MPRYEPMLAASGPIRGTEIDYGYEPKWDGWRAVVYIQGGRLTVRTRKGRDVSEGVPELRPLAAAVGDRNVVLDGELVANDGSPGSFYRLGARVASRHTTSRSQQVPLTLVAFDVLFLDGDLTAASYRERRAALEGLDLNGPAWCTTPSYEGCGAELFAACTELGLEGLVAKRLTGRYYPGARKNVWVKAKCEAWKRDHAQFRHAEPRRRLSPS